MVADCVQDGGELPYGECFLRNHRTIYIDLSIKGILGDKKSLPTMKYQEFTTRFPKQTMQYKQELDQLFMEQGIW